MKNTKVKKSNMLKKNSLLILGILISTVNFSCSKKELHATDYVKFVEDESNGLKVSKNIGEIDYRLQYKPIEYVLLKENNNNEDIKKRKEALEGMQYFTLCYSLVKNNKDILKFNLTSPDEYYERVNYFSFGLQNDIYLVEGKDTLKCNLFNYVRSYGLSPAADFVLAFDKSKQTMITDKLMVIEDKIFGGGIIKIKITKEDIKNIPELI